MAWFRRTEKLKTDLREELREELRAVSFQDVWGSGADTSVFQAASVATAVTLTPVWAAVRLISDTIASLPLQAYRKGNDEIRHPIRTPNVLANPGLHGTPFEWVQRACASLLLRGNAYGLITAVDLNGWPQQVEWLHPDDVSIKDNRATRRPEWLWLGRPVDAYLGRDSAGQLLHIPWFVIPGEVLGLSPIRAFASTIETGIMSQRFGRDFFRNGAIPSGVLETDQRVDEEQSRTVKARWKLAVAGRDVAVVGAGLSYKPITVPPEESQFLQTIKATATQVAAIYGLWPEDVGGESGSSMTYANIEHESISRAHRLSPYMTKLETHFSGLLPRPQYARFNLDAFLRSDLKSRYEAHEIGIRAGFLAPSEVRAIEDRPPLTDDQKKELEPAASSAPAVAMPAPGEMPVPGAPATGNVVPLPRAAN